MSANNPRDGNLRPFLMLITITVIGMAAFAVLVFLQTGALRPRTIVIADAARCPDPQPGQALVIVVPHYGAATPVICHTLQSQNARAERAGARERAR